MLKNEKWKLTGQEHFVLYIIEN